MSLSNLLHHMRPLHIGHRIALTLILILLAVAPSLANDGNISGTGSETDPYLIEDVEDWNKFAESVLNGNELTENSYQGKFVKLAANIGTEESPVTKKIGDQSHSVTYTTPINTTTLLLPRPFSGVFDGGNHAITVAISDAANGAALFGYVSGATIKNLTVVGTVSGGEHAAGLVGISAGTGNKIEDCVVATTVEGDSIGGILGHGTNGDIEIENCVFKGVLQEKNGSGFGLGLILNVPPKGVFMGWAGNGGTKIVKNSLYIYQNEQSLYLRNLDLVQKPDDAGSVTVTECYKTLNVGSFGELAYLDASAAPVDEESFVAEKIAVDGTIFYVVLKKHLMSGSGTEVAPYIINDEKEWNSFADLVGQGYTFAGKFIKLNADISVTKKVGVVKRDGTLVTPFAGTFDGGGRTIHADITESDGMGTALFGYINGAIIKNLTVTGEIHGGIHAAGLVGISKGSGNRIENCVVAATVNGGTHIGGILGHGSSSDISIDNCVFNGILNDGSTAKGVFFGWGDDGGTKTVSNCLYIQQDGQGTDYLDLVQMNAGSVAVTDCYKTADVGTYGTLAYLDAPTDAITEEKTVAGDTKFYVVTGYAIAVTSATTEMTTGTYRVSDDITVDERIVINGDVTLILDEGKTLNATKGIELLNGNKLTIDGKGMLNATGNEDDSGIGANDVGTLVIENGIINASGGYWGAGIGGSIDNIFGGSITINGGIVTAAGGFGAASIGGGFNSKGGDYGVCGNIAINGGRVTASGGRNSVGIGPGDYAPASGSVILGWTNEDDFIHVSSFDNIESIMLVDGKTFYYEENGKNVIVESVNDIAGKTLRPIYEKNSLKNAIVSGINPYYYYTGNKIDVICNVTDFEGRELVVDQDYTVSLNKSLVKDVGDYTLTITAKENGAYTGSKSISFSVFKKNLENANINDSELFYHYTGEKIDLVYNLTDSEGKKIVEGTDYVANLDKSPVKDVGDYTLTITATENGLYTGSKEIRFTVFGDYIPVTSSTFTMDCRYGVPYKVNNDASVSERINIIGDVTLILDEGKKLDATKGIELSKGNKLTVDGKGTLNATANDDDSGIGAVEVGTLVIENGIVNATGGIYGAGIGGSKNNISGGTIVINNGIITSNGKSGAGIGGGDVGVCGEISINGGKVTVNGGIGPGDGGNTSGTVTLGWTNEDDFIYAEKYGKVSSINFVENKSFYFTDDDGNVSVAKAMNMDGKKILPITNDFKNLKYADINGLQPYYLYTGKDTVIAYDVFDLEGNLLVKGIDYTEEFSRLTINDKGVYTLTVVASEKSGYTGRKKFNFIVADCLPFTSSTTTMNERYGISVYEVSDDVSISKRITVSGNVRLILNEGKTLNAQKGIDVSEGNALTIDGKGTLNATGDENFAGIGAVEVGTLVIENGIVNATGGDYGAGIGGSEQNSIGGTITINGGTVTSIGGSYGSGIGGGYKGSGGTIAINGGIVSAEGGKYGAGIGGGYRGFAGTISVRGGKVTAIAGKNASGIGSGDDASASGSVTLGWTSVDDFIYASNYGNVSSINFVENKYFYFTDDDGKVFGATTENIDGKKILPVTNKSDILKLNVSGIQPYYLYTGNDITIAYDVFDLDGKKLTKGTDYTGSFDKNPINDKGVYTLTITANENSGYTGSNNIRFIVADCLPVTSFTTTLAERYGISVYEVSEDVVVGERIVVSGNVRLVLDEGKTLTAKRGVEVSEGDALTIEGKGTLQAKGSSDKAGIGGGDGVSGGNITINGGIVTSTGGVCAAGIGGGDGASGGNITINGGTVTSTGGSNGAGIGGGYKGSGGIITIKGGIVTSTGGSYAAGIGGGYIGSGGTITIKGGAVTSTGGSDAAGIGGGAKGSGINIIINGGTVTSTGGSNGSGIGGGKNGSTGTIIVNDGTVTSTGGKHGSGIGGGNEGSGGTISINGGIVTAKGGSYGSGIGGGNKSSGGTITIKGGTVTSTGGYKAAGIGGGYIGSGGTVILNGGKVTAFAGEDASGMGPGYKGTGGTIMLGWTSEDDFIYADNYNNVQSISFIYDENENKEKQFYYVLGGKNKVASTDVIGRKTIYPYYGENSLKNAMVSGINHYYSYTGKDISIAYTIVDYNDKTLVKGSDYTEKINPWPIKNKGEYTLTVTAKEGSGYTDSKTICFTVFTDDDATLVTNETEEMTSGVYRVSSDVTVTTRIIVKGNVLLILDEGKTLTAPKGIEVSDGNALTIEGKGILDAHGNSYNAGIGGGQGFSSGIITINGGMVKSTGGESGSGIGGGSNGYGGIITINGGTVTSTGGNKGSGIGGGAKGSSRNITINGGVVIAKGGESGSGIGGGINYSGGKITINGGKVTSTGGSSGSGIGGGDKGYGGKITINAGTIVSAGGESGSGIGGGAEDHGGTILINGGSVTANGGESGSGIGGGANGSGGTVIVNGGKVSAKSNSGGSGIGPGSGKSGGTVMLGWTNEDDFIYASNYKNVKSLSFAEGKQFYYIKNGVNTVATTDDIGGGTLYPYFGENSLKNAVISGVEPFYIYSGDEIKLSYRVLDLEGKELVEGTDYESSFDKLPLKDMGEYTLTISAVESSDYVGSISVKFIIADAIPVTSSTVEMNDSYGLPYKVFDDVTVFDRIKIKGDVTLVLGKEKTLDALSGIQVSENNKLRILGEGAINAIGSERCAGIGGRRSGGTVIINGGTVTSNGGEYASGIGGGSSGSGGTVIINGGTVFSTGGKWGSGIGGGYNGSGGTVIINGGMVTSNGGKYASGIGGGSYGEGGTVVINGGKVTANAGEDASGIGPGGSSNDEVDVVISGSVTLGWTNVDDFIYATNYYNVASLSFAEGKQFYYTENGVNKVASIGDIDGKELHPYFGEHNLENASISGIELSYAYTGKAISPAYQIVDFNGLEISKANYVVSIMKDGVETQAVNTGEYTMVFTGKGEYKGTKEVKFSIVPKVILASGAIQVFEDENGKRAEIAGEYDGAEAVNITEDIKNVAVTFNREFTPNSGYATIMLPFDVNATKLTGVRSVIEFDGVKTDKNDNKTVGMRYVWCNATLGEQEELNKHPNCNGYSGELKAYTPYMIEMESATLGIKDAVTLKSNSGKIVGDAPVGNWVFRGTLQKKVWPKGTGIINEGRLWAFAAAERSGAKIGEFVQFGGNNWANPFRAYLVECKKTDNGLDCKDDSETQPSLVSRYRFADALASTNSAEKSAGAAATDQPLVMRQAAASETASLSSMDIVIVYGDKDSEGDKERPTVIGRMNPATGEIRMLPRTKQTYDLKGRRVGNGKKAKGAYYKK